MKYKNIIKWMSIFVTLVPILCTTVTPSPCDLTMQSNKYHPLLIQKPQRVASVVYPTGVKLIVRTQEKYVSMQSGDSYHVTCGEKNILVDGNPTNKQFGILRCTNGILSFDNRNNVVDWVKIKCEGRENQPVAMVRTFARPNFVCTDGVSTSIAWKYGPNEHDYIRQIEICSLPGTTSYTRHEINKQNLEFTVKNVNMKSDFILKSSDFHKAFRQPGLTTKLNGYGFVPGKVMTRGHLSPKCDFVYPAERRATYNYKNALPQWEHFNCGSWQEFECRIQKSTIGNHLIIYTGGFKIQQAPNGGGDVFLKPEPTDSTIPVPLAFWKVIYATDERKAIGFVGSNSLDTTINRALFDLFGCLEICKTNGWVDADLAFGERKGFVFCCPYDKMGAKVPAILRITDIPTTAAILQYSGVQNCPPIVPNCP